MDQLEQRVTALEAKVEQLGQALRIEKSESQEYARKLDEDIDGLSDRVNHVEHRVNAISRSNFG